MWYEVEQGMYSIMHSLFHSLITLGMKEFLKYSDSQETILNELPWRRELFSDGGES